MSLHTLAGRTFFQIVFIVASEPTTNKLQLEQVAQPHQIL